MLMLILQWTLYSPYILRQSALLETNKRVWYLDPYATLHQILANTSSPSF